MITRNICGLNFENSTIFCWIFRKLTDDLFPNEESENALQYNYGCVKQGLRGFMIDFVE